jgi:lysyl-tRNA synthetase class 2
MNSKNWKRIKNSQLDKNLFIKRAKIIRAIREFFWNTGFLEVETPEVVALPGQEPYLDVFETELHDDRGKKIPAALVTSPEYAMKKILAAGYQKIFQLTKAFRNNESLGGIHNPEFTILEWYRQSADYLDIMKDTEALIKFIIKKLGLPTMIAYQGTEIDLSGRWHRLTVTQAMKNYAGVSNLSDGGIRRAAKKKGYRVENDEPYDSIFFRLFLNEVEDKLPKNLPIFIYDYPAELAALAKRKNDNPELAERFELYIGGLEIANAFSELLDAKEQERRFLKEQELRKQSGRKIYPIDEELLAALSEIKNPCGGIALGIDRLVMLLTNQKDINNVLFFPAKELFHH